MFATEVIHFLIDAVQAGLSPTNREEMHQAVRDVEDLWRKHDPATAPPAPEPEPEPEGPTSSEQAAAKDAKIAALEQQIAELKAASSG